MKIITVNLPQSYLKMIDGMVGENGLYPSRSELIRVAVRDFLICELEAAASFRNYLPPIQAAPVIPQPEVDSHLFVQIPLGSTSNGVPEYKTFRLVKKDTRPDQIPETHVKTSNCEKKGANPDLFVCGPYEEQGQIHFQDGSKIPVRSEGHL